MGELCPSKAKYVIAEAVRGVRDENKILASFQSLVLLHTDSLQTSPLAPSADRIHQISWVLHGHRVRYTYQSARDVQCNKEPFK